MQLSLLSGTICCSYKCYRNVDFVCKYVLIYTLKYIIISCSIEDVCYVHRIFIVVLNFSVQFFRREKDEKLNTSTEQMHTIFFPL